MSIITKTKKLYTILTNPKLITKTPKYLFVLSHMRSRSSLLSHILGSNPSVCGYFEQQSQYSSKSDLFNMRIGLYQECAKDINHTYFFDSILHNELIQVELLESLQLKTVFLLREPNSTIKSIVSMGQRLNNNTYSDLELAVDYYCSRLLMLEKFSETLSGNYFFIESDDLIDNSDEILESLSGWLGLNNPLSKEYKVFEKTGDPNSGDSSPHIKSGHIKKTKEHENIDIPEILMKKGQFHYEKCKSKLLANLL